MRQITCVLLLAFSLNQCLGQKGFPKQFQAVFNVTVVQSGDLVTQGVQSLLYDYVNLRARYDYKGWRSNQNETNIIIYKPQGAEPDSVSRLLCYSLKGLIVFSRLRMTMSCITSVLIIQKSQK